MEYSISFFTDPVISAGVLLYLDRIGIPPSKVGTFPRAAGVCAYYCLGMPPDLGLKISQKKLKSLILSETNPNLILMCEAGGGGFYIFTQDKTCGFDDNLIRAGSSDFKNIIKNAQGRNETPLHRRVNGLVSMEAFLKRSGSEAVISVLSFEPGRDGELMPVSKRWLVIPEAEVSGRRIPVRNTDEVGNYLRKTEDIWLPKVLL
jgi:hypothetical protein